MEIGNNFIGLTMEKEYASLRIFPIGIEMLTIDGLNEVAFVLGPIEVSVSIKKNYTLFRAD